MIQLKLTATTPSEQRILEYLQNNASETLAEKINNGTPFEKDGKPLTNKKSLSGFMKYACGEARNLAAKGETAACVEDSVVYELQKPTLDIWLDDHLDMSRHMLRALAQRIRRTSNTMADLIFSDVPGRVAKAILDLGHRFGRMERGHVTVRHGLTQEELAQLVGASRETVNKALADFASRGWIDVHIGAVEVYEPERLRARSR